MSRLSHPKNLDSYKYIDHDIENITEDTMTEGCNFFTQTGNYFNVSKSKDKIVLRDHLEKESIRFQNTKKYIFLGGRGLASFN